MANINAILKNNGLKKERIEYETQMIHYTHLITSKKQFYNFGPEKFKSLADTIDLSGKVYEPLIVRMINVDKYEILSGHKRAAATKYLVEEKGKTKYSFLPCHVIDVNNWLAEYILISTNDYPIKSEYEKMMEVIRLQEILPHLSGDESLKGRILRKMISDETDICVTRVGNYQNIYKHLCKEAMNAFKNEKFGINIAIKLASLDETNQKKLVARDSLSIANVNEFIKTVQAKSVNMDTTKNTTNEITPEIPSSANIFSDNKEDSHTINDKPLNDSSLGTTESKSPNTCHTMTQNFKDSPEEILYDFKESTPNRTESSTTDKSLKNLPKEVIIPKLTTTISTATSEYQAGWNKAIEYCVKVIEKYFYN